MTLVFLKERLNREKIINRELKQKSAKPNKRFLATINTERNALMVLVFS